MYIDYCFIVLSLKDAAMFPNYGKVFLLSDFSYQILKLLKKCFMPPLYILPIF